MKKIILVTLMTFSINAFACFNPMSETEVITAKNKLVMDVLNETQTSIEQVTEVVFTDNFSMIRGRKGSCDALQINGDVQIKKGSSCWIKVNYSTALDKLDTTITEQCL